MPESATSKAFRELIEDLMMWAQQGDKLATRCLAGLELLDQGWRYGDPDPPDHDPGGEPMPVSNVIEFRRAA